MEADKRRKRDIARQRMERQRKEELEDKAEAATDALAFVVATSPPATAEQIAAFEADLTLYDTATVDALLENDRQLSQARADLDALLSQAFVMEDGRRVFRTENGAQVFDEFGQEIASNELDPAIIPDHHPTWEEFSPVRDRYAALVQEREALIDYQQQLDAAREALAEGEITQAELEDLQAQLIKDMPEAVRARLPQDHPATQAENAVKTAAASSKPEASSPSLDGLRGFAPPNPR